MKRNREMKMRDFAERESWTRVWLLVERERDRERECEEKKERGIERDGWRERGRRFER